MQLKFQRLLPAGLLVCGLLLGAPTRGEPNVSSRVDVYVDDWIQVVSPAVSGRVVLGPSAGLTGTYAVDVLSGATRTQVDLVSSATTFDERRHQGDLALTLRRGEEQSLTASHTVSAESDYLSSTTRLAGSTELLTRMVVLSAAYRLGFDRFGTSSDESITGRATNHGLELDWTQILGRRTRGSVALAADASLCDEALGCQSSPYRYVPVFELDEQQVVMSLRERHPSTRYRGAGALRLSQALWPGSALHLGWRGYTDTWQVRGHTLGLGLAQGALQERLVVRLDVRGGQQSSASFYRDSYQVDETEALLPEYRSADPELAALRSGLVRGRVEWTWLAVGPLRELGLSARVARLGYRYGELTELPERDAWIIGGGLNGTL